VIVYQEQVMHIASSLANFSLEDATFSAGHGEERPQRNGDPERKISGGGAKNRIPPAKAEKIFELMAKFAEYGFNKSTALLTP